MYTILVGGLVAIFYFPINIGLFIIPIDYYFSEGWPNHQPVIYITQYIDIYIYIVVNSG